MKNVPGAPRITAMRGVPVAGHDGMRMNLSGAHGPFFTRNDCGTLGNTLLRETEKITIAFESTAVILANFLRMAAYLVVALLLSWKLTVLTLGLLAVAAEYADGSETYAVPLALSRDPVECIVAEEKILRCGTI